MALGTGAAFAAVLFASLVARPGLGIVYAEGYATLHDVTLGEVGIGCKEGDAVIGACADGMAHGFGKLRTTVGIDGVVS